MAYKKTFRLYWIGLLLLVVALSLMAYFLLGFSLFASILLGVFAIILLVSITYSLVNKGERANQTSSTRLASTSQPRLHNAKQGLLARTQPGSIAQPVASSLPASRCFRKLSLKSDNPVPLYLSQQLEGQLSESTEDALTPVIEQDFSFRDTTGNKSGSLSNDQGVQLSSADSSIQGAAEKEGQWTTDSPRFSTRLNEKKDKVPLLQGDNRLFLQSQEGSAMRPAPLSSGSLAEVFQSLPFPESMAEGVAKRQQRHPISRPSPLFISPATEAEPMDPYRHPLFVNPSKNAKSFSFTDSSYCLTQAQADAIDQAPFLFPPEAGAMAFPRQVWEESRLEIGLRRASSDWSRDSPALREDDLAELKPPNLYHLSDPAAYPK